MLTTHTSTFRLILLFAFISIAAMPAAAQTNRARSLVTGPVNQNQMVMLRGNTHPMARVEFDRGAAPDSLPMDSMMLGLKRSPEQDAALETLLREQQDRTSPNYHKWVTPEEFGARFGPSDHDVQAVTSWLQSNGFQMVRVGAGRTVVHFSGTALQVQEAFHTAIHRYVVDGEEHWANESDPQIPSRARWRGGGCRNASQCCSATREPFARNIYEGCCRKREAGAAALYFSGARRLRFLPEARASRLARRISRRSITSCRCGTQESMAPAQTIAVVGDSNINLADVSNFRTIFGLPQGLPE